MELLKEIGVLVSSHLLYCVLEGNQPIGVTRYKENILTIALEQEGGDKVNLIAVGTMSKHGRQNITIEHTNHDGDVYETQYIVTQVVKY